MPDYLLKGPNIVCRLNHFTHVSRALIPHSRTFRFAGSDIDGSHTAVCQRKDKTSEAHSCGSANDRTIRYADNVLTMVYKSGSHCSNNIARRTIITFHCDPSAGVGRTNVYRRGTLLLLLQLAHPVRVSISETWRLFGCFRW